MIQKPEESKKNSSADKTEKIDEETERLLKENRVNLEKKTYEEVRDELFALTEAAKEKGFIQGFRYAVMLMREITVKL